MSTQSWPKVAIIILNWKGKIPVESEFFGCDPSSKPVCWVEYDRITAEMGGIPKEEDRLNGLRPSEKIVLIQTGANLGFAGGNNVTIRYVLPQGLSYIGLLNNDTVAGPEYLTHLVQTLET